MIRSFGKLTLVGILTAVMALAPTPVSAQTNAAIATNTPAPANPAAPRGKSMRTRGKIVALDKASMTITIGVNLKRPYGILSTTKLLRESKPATFDDFAVGDEVNVSFTTTPDGKYVARSISSAPAPKTAPAAAAPPSAAAKP